MCGICGVYHYRGGAADAAFITRQIQVLRHRGPDDIGVWCEGPVGLAQQRLAIVDLSPGGHQPMPNEDGKRVAFASELKALLIDPAVPREIDEQALADYLTFQYVPSPRTIFRGIHKLAPGHSLVVDSNGPRTQRWWSLPVDTDDGHA